MEVWKRLLASAASVLGIAAVTVPITGVADAYAATDTRIAEAEEACREALEEDTIEALEEFLRRYGDVDTACTALALEALNGFGGNGGDGGNGQGPQDGGYAQ